MDVVVVVVVVVVTNSVKTLKIGDNDPLGLILSWSSVHKEQVEEKLKGNQLICKQSSTLRQCWWW